ncbi:MAG: hypothetical protein N2654_03065, partial [Deltaproteobacteria bacterium]|nr:hypothetical protein [Deltaproteobacteria bacterium]
YKPQEKVKCKTTEYIAVETSFSSARVPRTGLFPVIFDQNLRVDPGFGKVLTSKLAQALLQENIFPAVETIERWEPVIRDEFFSANHVTLKLARELDLDYILIFYYKAESNRETIYTKILDARKNITVFYGSASVFLKPHWLKLAMEDLNLYEQDLRLKEYSDSLVNCVVRGILGGD